jgi:hypothetical protein
MPPQSVFISLANSITYLRTPEGRAIAPAKNQPPGRDRTSGAKAKTAQAPRPATFAVDTTDSAVADRLFQTGVVAFEHRYVSRSRPQFFEAKPAVLFARA